MKIKQNSKAANGQRPIYRLLGSLTLILLLFTFSTPLNAAAAALQQRVTGKVIAANDKGPIIGATVVVKGTTVGVTTDIDGKFEIQAAIGDILTFAFIGFKTQEVKVDGSEIEISMIVDITDLDEVMVIGYGVQKKKLVTGATSQVKGDELEKRNSMNPLQALQGQAAGINITSTSGQPGEGMKVVIRGLGTIGNAGPLYIVDGVQTGSIDYLNGSDIESIDVLKDAASAAIYGSQAANGVVLVTTKQGTRGSGQVTFDAYYGMQNVANKIDLLNAKEYATIMNEQHLNSGGSVAGLPFDVNNLPAYVASGSADTDWLGEMFVSNAITQNYSVGINGGTKESIYSMSLSYSGQDGIVGGKGLSDYKRYGGRFNTESNLYGGKLKVGQHITFAYIKKHGISVGNQYGNTLRGAFNTSPLLPMYDDNGDYFNTASTDIVDQNGDNYWLNTESSPYAGMVIGNHSDNSDTKLMGDVYAEIELAKNLSFRSTFGLDYYAGDGRSFTPIYELSIYSFNSYTKASQRMSKNISLSLDNLLRYSYTANKNKLDVMVGMSARSSKGSWMYSENSDLAFNDLEHAWINNATNQEWAKLSIQGGPNSENKMLSYFGRVQYNFDETYLFNATLRADGSSNFAAGNRWGYFPSVSAGWVISNEDFMASSSSYLNFMKIRASWGQNGNQNIGTFQYLAPISFTQTTYAFGDTEGISTNGSKPSRLGNDKLKWETSEQLNLGFDAYLLNSNLAVNFDYYYKTTKDWLIIAPVLATAGADAPYINGGDVLNTGVELALTYRNQIGELKYDVNINGAFNKNEVQNIPTDDGIIHGAANTLYNNSEEFYRAESGHPIGYFWGLKTDGLFQNKSEVSNYTNSDGKIIQPTAKPGDVRYIDQNDDGIISELDKVELGNPNPDFTFGLSVSLYYKAFDFSIVTNGVAGNQIVQSYRNHTGKYSNYTSEILDRWNGEGTSTTIPRVTNTNTNYKFSDLYVKNGSYIRLSNVTLGFDVASVTRVKALSQCRIYAQVQNLYTLTKYSGMDPEVGYGFDNGDSDKFSSGVDLGFYPHPRTILFGVSVKF